MLNLTVVVFKGNCKYYTDHSRHLKLPPTTKFETYRRFSPNSTAVKAEGILCTVKKKKTSTFLSQYTHMIFSVSEF